MLLEMRADNETDELMEKLDQILEKLNNEFHETCFYLLVAEKHYPNMAIAILVTNSTASNVYYEMIVWYPSISPEMSTLHGL